MSRLPHYRIALMIIAAAIALSAPAALAQIKKGKTRPLTTSQLMKGVVKPHCDVVKKGLEATTITDEGWTALALSAALLNESSYVLMDDGRSPDGVWSDAATKSLRAGTMDLVKAIAAKNATDAKAALGFATKSCKGCHEKHKSK